jgi:hypothetical protein
MNVPGVPLYSDFLCCPIKREVKNPAFFPNFFPSMRGHPNGKIIKNPSGVVTLKLTQTNQKQPF